MDDALFRTGEIQYAEGKYPDAIKRFREVSSRRRNELAGEADYWIGESYYKLDQIDSALVYYTKSRTDFPQGKLADYAWYSTGWLLQQRKMSAEAIDAYSQLIKRHPEQSACGIGTCPHRRDPFAERGSGACIDGADCRPARH